jgi:SAM-dependent methyltransferase
MVGDPVLELGCGTGRVLEYLAPLDMDLTGVDSSPVMLNRARNRLQSAPKVRLVESDMSRTNLPDAQFGIVIIALNGLLHATTIDRQRAVLSECYRTLDPRGLLFVDIPNPHAGPFEFEDNQVVREGSWKLSDGRTVTKFGARTLQRVEQLVTTNLWYDTTTADGSLSRFETSFDLRYLYPGELVLMLESAGFREWQTYGTYELDSFTDSSPRFIVTAEKIPST